jgi:hypothetical protein
MENSKLLTFQSPAAIPVCATYRNIKFPHFVPAVYLRSVRSAHPTPIMSQININGLFSGEHKLCTRLWTNRSYNVDECLASIVLGILTSAADTHYTIS